MENKSSRKYNRIAKLVGILSGFILVLGTSYAVFRVTTTGEKENVVSAGKLDVRIENEQNEINLGNTLPQTEEEGKQNTPYTFDIVNKGTINAMYDLYIEVNNDSTLDASLVRYYLTVIEDGEEKQVTPTGSIISGEEENTKEGKKAYKIDTKYLDVDKTNTYKLYLWIDYDATKEEAANKVFKANIRVDAEQIYKENKLVKQVDVSENNDGSVIAYMYENDTIVIKGKGKIESGLSDKLTFSNDNALPNLKKVLQDMNADASSITNIDEFYAYLNEQGSDFSNQFNNHLYFIISKEVLKDMNKDSDTVTNIDSLEDYLQKLGWMDENGSETAAGEKYFLNFNSKYNKNYSPERDYTLSKIILEDGVTNIPQGLYTGNQDIKEVSIPASVKIIEDHAFDYCKGLKTISIPSGVLVIGDSAFFGCTNLSNVTFSNGLTTIEDNAFSHCEKIEKIILPNSIIAINDSSFSYCYNLNTIILSENLISISSNVFNSCYSLTSIEIPDGVTNIGSYSFSNCTNLSSINIPNSVVSVESSSFNSWSNLQTINIDNTKEYVDTNWHEGWDKDCNAKINYLR